MLTATYIETAVPVDTRTAVFVFIYTVLKNQTKSIAVKKLFSAATV